jgi:hypothetical protein
VAYFSIAIETEIESFVDKSEYSALDDTFRILDYDWNDHMMRVSYTESIPFSVTMILTSDMQVESVEIYRANTELG